MVEIACPHPDGNAQALPPSLEKRLEERRSTGAESSFLKNEFSSLDL